MTDPPQESSTDAPPEADSPSDAPPPQLAAGGGKLQFAPPDAPTAPLPPREKRPPPQPTLRCPFCSGRRFDFGRDLYAGAEALLYCRRTPAPGRRPEEVLSLPMKAAVCLDCGYVATMVDIAQLNAPIRKPGEAAVLGQTARAPGPDRSPAEKAAEALGMLERVDADAADALSRMNEQAIDEAIGPVEAERQAGGTRQQQAPTQGGLGGKSIFQFETED